MSKRVRFEGKSSLTTSVETMKAATTIVAKSRREPELPLIAHLIYRLDMGGLENGLVNLINRIPDSRYRHAVICLTDETEFRNRIQRKDVQIIALHKRPGKDLLLHLRVWRALRKIRPALVHTRNLAAFEYVLPATLAGVRCRIHSEHGRDVNDIDGTSLKYRVLRRLLAPLVHRFIPLSLDLRDYLQHSVGIPSKKLRPIANGVDSSLFRPAAAGRATLPVAGFAPPGTFVIGTVGRMEAVKDPLTLARAFVQLLEKPGARDRLRLVMIGDGSLGNEVEAILRSSDSWTLAWLPGRRNDVPDLLRAMDLFVLPSIGEGISNAILEAMASGLPIVATQVGGNSQLVVHGETGLLVPPQDPGLMAAAISTYLHDERTLRLHGRAARMRAEVNFSIERMVEEYDSVYREMLGERRAPAT